MIMPIDQVSVGRIYKMSSGEKVIVTREWTAQDGHMRVEGHTVGAPREYTYAFVFSKREFLDKAESEVPAASAQ
jgi:hypothetical protein